MKRFNVGIIGCGTIFPMHAESLKKTPGVRLVSVCDIKPARAKKMASKYKVKAYLDYKRMLKIEKLDAVHICTPHHLHLPMVTYAANKGIHILLEKPMGLNPQEAQKEIAVAKKNKVKLGVVFQNRFNPGSQLVKRKLEAGRLGKLIAAKLVLSYHKPDSYYKKSDWKGTWDKEGGGVVIDQAIHSLDILRWLANSPIEYVLANIANRMHEYIKVEDSADGIIKFKNGAYACFYTINCYSYDADVEMELHCEKGKVKIIKDSAWITFNNGKKISAKPRADEYIDYGKGVKDYWGICHWHLVKDFYKALSENHQPSVNADEGKKTQDLVWAIYKSSQTKRKVYL